MAHGDDAGLMLPPRIAPIQVGLSIYGESHCTFQPSLHLKDIIFIIRYSLISPFSCDPTLVQRH